MRIHISSETASALRNWKAFKISLRGQMDMKGKGKMTTYWLDGELDSIFNNESLNESLNAQSVEDDDAVKCP